MEVTDVQIKLDPHPTPEKGLLAFADVVLDGALVLHDVKVLRTLDGHLFLGMPARKLTTRCPRCESRAALEYRHCPQCGVRLRDDRIARDEHGVTLLRPDGRRKTHKDLIHPIHREAREAIEGAVLEAYHDAVAEAEAAAATREEVACA